MKTLDPNDSIRGNITSNKLASSSVPSSPTSDSKDTKALLMQKYQRFKVFNEVIPKRVQGEKNPLTNVRLS